MDKNKRLIKSLVNLSSYEKSNNKGLMSRISKEFRIPENSDDSEGNEKIDVNRTSIQCFSKQKLGKHIRFGSANILVKGNDKLYNSNLNNPAKKIKITDFLQIGSVKKNIDVISCN